ncbi:MAG: hypothetical protein WBV82_28340 [Myxococcaceae bacterium]
MRYPPRLGHLATRKVVVAKLWPTYAESHRVDEQEAIIRLERAVSGQLWDDLLETTWQALVGSTKRLDEEGLLEKVAGALKDRPLRPGRVAKVDPDLSAFLVLADLEAGTAGDAARRVMESEEGRRRGAAGLAAAGRFLAAELTRK